MDKLPFPIEKFRVSDQVVTVIAYQAIVALRETGRSSRVIWQGEPPLLPVRQDNWTLGPVTDEYTLPVEVQRRINILRYNDIPIKQVLIAHEVPQIAPKPVQAPVMPPQPKKTYPTPVSEPSTGVWKGVGIVLLVVLGLLALPILLPMALAVVLAPLALYSVICGGDPVVACVLEDDTWLAVAWWTE